MVVEYYAPSIGELFVGIGAMLILCAVAYFVYQASRFYKQCADKEDDYNDAEIIALRKTTKGMNIDIDKFRLDRDVMKQKSFRKKLEKKIVEEYFDSKGVSKDEK